MAAHSSCPYLERFVSKVTQEMVLIIYSIQALNDSKFITFQNFSHFILGAGSTSSIPRSKNLSALCFRKTLMAPSSTGTGEMPRSSNCRRFGSTLSVVCCCIKREGGINIYELGKGYYDNRSKTRVVLYTWIKLI